MSKTKASPIPEGYHTVTPYLFVKDGLAALDFYHRAFNAKEMVRFMKPDGRLGHAEIKIGDSMIMLADEFPEMHAYSPSHYKGSPVMLHLYVPDVDALFQQAVAAGAKVVQPVEDQFYGDRSGGILDPEGHSWYLATRKEELSPDEIFQRLEKMKK